MKILTLKYGHVRNLGNYESARLEVEAMVNETEDAYAAFLELREAALDMLYGRKPVEPEPEPEVAIEELPF